MHRAVIRSLLAGLLLFASQAVHALEVHHARTPEPPPGAPVLAGYMVLENHGNETVHVTGATSADFARISLHETVVEEDTTRMQSVDAYEVPPGGRTALAPRGKHLMLFDPRKDVVAGDTLQITLETTTGPVEVTLQVISRDELEATHEGEGHGEHH